MAIQFTGNLRRLYPEAGDLKSTPPSEFPIDRSLVVGMGASGGSSSA